jgi:hypothetical protein
MLLEGRPQGRSSISRQFATKLWLGTAQPPLRKEGRMKSLISLWQVASEELGARCGVSTSMDCKTVRARSEHEGLSFLTITLPTFAKALQKGLEQGKVDPTMFPSFRNRGSLPLFLRGFLDRVFDPSTGILLDEPCVDSIFAIRQLTLMFEKIRLDSSPKRHRDAMHQFIKCEQEVRQSDKDTAIEDLRAFSRMSRLLWANLFSDVDRKVYHHEIIPRHGPGKTADRLLGNRKFDLTEWPERLEHVFPFGEYALANWRMYYLQDSAVFLEPGAERPVRVVAVPKTLKTPRIIAIEPSAMQYMQQGLRAAITGFIEYGNSLSQPFTGYEKANYPFSQMISFDEQEPNQFLAHQGSLHGNLATLDLSEASDRVSNQLVREMLHDHPNLFEAVDATRSRKADVLGHGVIRLAKFASMGSALCFPFEAMVFLTIIFIGIQQELRRQLTVEDIISFTGQVRVYGDDIIVPVEYTHSVIRALESFGFKVNADKSFWNGKFRESCGKEYYDGHDVSITRVRSMLPARLTDVPEIVSTVSTRNQLYFAGMWKTAAHLDKLLGRVLRHYPNCSPGSPLLGRHSVFTDRTVKWDVDRCTLLVKGYVVKSTPPASKVSGEGALLKCLLKRSDEPFADSKHLERSGRPKAVNIKLGWVQPW